MVQESKWGTLAGLNDNSNIYPLWNVKHGTLVVNRKEYFEYSIYTIHKGSSEDEEVKQI